MNKGFSFFLTRSSRAKAALFLGVVAALVGVLFVSLARAQEAPPVDVKVNFQPEALNGTAPVLTGGTPVPVPAGYAKDVGQGYDDARGYGWVRQDSLAGATHEPLSIVPNSRDRNLNTRDQRLDTLMHMQAPSTSTTMEKTPAAWEYALPDGAYHVTVAVGDASNGNDAENHAVNVEGVEAIQNFPKSALANGIDARHRTATVKAEVADGRLTVDAAGGTNTKINYVDIREAPAGGDFGLKVNFQSDVAPVPAGYVRDFGEAYGARGAGFGAAGPAGLEYGWVSPGTATPLNLVTNGRDRNNAADVSAGLDQRLDTLMHMQANSIPGAFTGVKAEGAWEVAVPDGAYDVAVSAGDPSPGNDATTHRLNVEGENVVASFPVASTTSGAARFASGTATVDVTDGRLTVDATGGGVNTKINYIDLSRTGDVSAPTDTTPPDAPTVDLAAGSDSGSSSTDNLTNDDTPTFTGEAEAGGTVEVFAAGTSLGTDEADNSGYSVTANKTLAEETTSITAVATDAAGNPSAASAALNVTVDKTKPDVSIASGPTGAIDQSSATFEFTAGDGSSVACELDGNADNACASPKTYTNLDDGDYTFKLRSADGAGNAGEATQSFTVNTPGPNVPSITGPANNSYDTDGDLTVSGTAEAESAIELFEGTLSRGTATAGANGDWSIDLADVVDGEHRYTARATKNGKTSGDSAAITVNVDTAAPGAPAGLSAEGRRGAVALNWDDNPASDNVAGYNVYRGETENGAYTKLNGGLLTVSAYDDAPLPDEATRHYRVMAVDAAGNESNAAAANATTPAAPDETPPGAPTGLAAVPGDGRVDLDWAGNGEGDLAGYNVYRSTTATVNTGAAPLNASPLGESSYADTAVQNGTTYYYAVKAADGAGNLSAASSTQSARPLVEAKCAKRSTLECAAIKKTGAVALDFSGSEGGLADKDGQNTGFTMVDPPSARLAADNPVFHADVPGYEPGKLDVSGGKLTVSSNKGIMYRSPGTGTTQSTETNSQINALGVGMGAAGEKVRLETTITKPAFPTAGNSEQGGLWFGLNEDNYAKLVLVNMGNGTVKMQLAREIGAISNGPTGGALVSADEVNTANATVATGTAVKLVLEATAPTGGQAAGTLTGTYKIGDSAEQTLQALALPASFFEGTGISSSGAEKATFAGLSATHRRGSTPINAVFENFSATTSAADATAPTVTNKVPADNATGVGRDANVEATFSEAMDEASVEAAGNFVLAKQGGGAVDAAVLYDAAANKATLNPATDLQAGTTYAATIEGGTSGVADAAGNPLAADESWSFTTEPENDTTAPATPANLAATAGDGKVDLAWSAVSAPDLAGYNVYRDGAATPLNSAPLSATGFSDTGLTNGTAYSYTVSAVDGSGNESAKSPAAQATPQAAPQGNPLALEFDRAVAGTVNDKDGEGTGFAGVQPNTAGDQYQAGKLDLQAQNGKLVLTAMAGTNTARNDLKNALRLAHGGTKPYEVGTRLVGPLTNMTTSAHQGGIYLGPDQNNYVKLVANHSGANGTQIQFFREINGTTDATTRGEVGFKTFASAEWAAIQTLDLFLTVDPTTGVVEAEYAVNGGARQGLPTAAGTRPSMSTYTVPAASRAAFFNAESKAGILAFTLDAPEIPVTFERFEVKDVEAEPDTTAPAAPQNLRATAGDAEVDLAWDANAEADVDGYNVYRGTTSAVDTGGAPLNASPLGQPGYADTSVQNGTTYHYVVQAVDTSANKSAPSARVSATPRAATGGQPFSAKINFQSAAAAVPTGYFRDYGQAYGARSAANQGSGLSYGWVTPGTSTPVDLSTGGTQNLGNGRDRNTAQVDGRLDTLMHMLAGSSTYASPFNGKIADGAWEISVPNGTYEVTVAAGDPAVNSDPERHTINVENTNVIRDFVPSGAAGADTRHQVRTATVAVNDGRITVDANGGANTKINFIDILSVETGPDTTPPAAPVNAQARAGDSRVTVTWDGNSEPDIAGYNVYVGTSAEGAPLNGSTLLQNAYLIDRNLTNGAERTYVIEAVDKSGNKSAVTRPVGATPRADATDDRPQVSSAIPPEGATGVPLRGVISAQLGLVAEGVDDSTFSPQTVRIVKVSDGSPVSSSYGTSGGNDVINAIPNVKLEPNTRYRFEITDGVKDLNGIQFVPFSSTFTTGTSDVFTPPGVTKLDLPGVSFSRVAQQTPSKTYTSVTFGPDGKLYAGTTTGEIYRFDAAADGTLSNPTLIDTVRQSNTANGGQGDCNTSTVGNNGCTKNRLIVGMTFEPGSTAENPKLWVTHSTFGFRDMKDWGGKLSVLSGQNLGEYRDVLVNLPRSSKDHLTNSVSFKDGKIYIPVGATTAMGAYDQAWKGTERLLSAAVIEVDYQNIRGTLDAKTVDGGGTYDPYAPGAPVKIYATGVRNAVDLVWHSNGHLYAPTNGSAGGSNVPATPSNFQDLDSCKRRGYAGPAVPDFDGAAEGTGASRVSTTQLDYLFDVVKGGYYGNPNPSRCEWVLNLGDPTTKRAMSGSGVGEAAGEVDEYPDGTLADPNYRGWAYNFINNKSPNGAIEYKGNNFGGKLEGKLIVARYTTDDIIVLDPAANGDIARDNAEVPGFTKVPGSDDPLDLTEDPRNGNIYVTEGVKNPPDGTGKITLLKAADAGTARPADAKTDKERMVFNDVQNGAASASQTVAVKNAGGENLTINSVGLSGTNANQFQVTAGPAGSVTLTPGQTQQVSVAFNPTSAGPKSASLDIATNDPDSPTTRVNLRGLGTLGTGGSNEPSLQWILDTYEIPVNVGDPNPADNGLPTDAKLGDEVAGMSKLEAAYSDAPVTVEPLAVFGPQHAGGTATKVGRYVPGASTQKSELFAVPNSGHQSLNPGAQGSFNFETPDSFGLYSIWPFFNDREVYSEDDLNAWETNAANRHKVRVYPLKKADGTVEQNAYIVATEEHTSGYDYQDVVYIIRNVRAAGGIGEIEVNAKERVFSGVKGTTSAAQTVEVSNRGNKPLDLSGVALAGPNAQDFSLAPTPAAPATLQAGEKATFSVRFAPRSTVIGSLEATLRIASNDVDEGTTEVGLYGLSTNGEQGNNEPPLSNVVKTLGYPINVGGTGLILGTNPAPIGDENSGGLFRKAGTGPVGITPVARYSPDQLIPFGFYTLGANGEPNRTTVASMDVGHEQELNPPIASGGAGSFDPGVKSFGFFTQGLENRLAYSQDSQNQVISGKSTAHAVRSYPAKDRSGRVIPNTFIVAFEDATNGDYQDYVFLVTNVAPSDGTEPPALKTEKFNFQPDQVDSGGRAVATGGTPVPTPEGYTKDTGQAFDAGRGYGWATPAGTPEDLTLNGRQRTTPSDPVLRTLIIMQGKNASGAVGTATNPTPVAWERVVPNGDYTVKVGVGDSAFFDGTDGVRVEDAQVVPNTQRAAGQTHLSGTADVTVTDGKLTVLTTGTNTKLNFVEITGDDTAPPPPPSATKKINFQPDAATVPDGYAKDAGLGFDAGRGYGWVAPGTQNPANLAAQTRERNLVNDQRLDTLVIMQPGPGNPALTAGSWEHALPDGAYEVTLSVGDAGFTNSVHNVNVEGVNVIDGHVPTDANKFKSATVTVNVTDGRLTVDAAGGDQTKLNYVDIVPAGDATPDETDPTVSATLGGTKNGAGAYLKRATLTIGAEDNQGGSGIKSLAYSVNGGAFEAYTVPVDFTAAGEYVIVARATDNAGNEATAEEQRFTVVIPPPGRGEIEVENLDGVPFPDRLVFNRIQNPEEGTTVKDRDPATNAPTSYIPPNTVHDVATLRVKNTGPDALSVEELRISDTSRFRLAEDLPLPAVVKPGESLDVPVRFVYSSASTTSSLQTGTLTVVSDDTDEPETRVDLAGFWQIESEGGKEPNFGQILATYGYGTSVPQGSAINTKGKLAAQGDEILSPYWLAADASRPVSVRQLAAFHTQGNTASFGWTQKNNYNMTTVLTHAGVDGQSFLPRKNDANRTPGPSTFNAPRNASNQLVPFGFRSDPEHSDHAVNTAQGRAQIDYDQGCVAPCGHHFRTWPALDRSGRPIPNAYLMTMDYAGINYDFQDNVYLVTNVKPENPVLDPAAPAPLPGAASLKLEFDKNIPNTLVDKNNVGTGFGSTQPNKNDVEPGSDSYKKEFLEVAPSAPGTLAVTTSGTTNGGTTNGLVNGLRLPFDGSGGEYTTSARLVGPLNNLGAGQGGVMFGSDQDNFVKLAATNRGAANTPSIEFFAERGGNNATANGNGTISTAAIPNNGNVSSLDLYLIADKATGEIRAAYRADDGALTAMAGKLTLTDAQMGRFFAEQAKAGIIAHHGTATNAPATLTFDRFAVTPGVPDPAAQGRNALYRLDTGTAQGSTYTDAAGNAWTSDTGLYTPATAINEGNNTDAIENTEDDALYRTYRGNVGNVAQAQRVLTYNLPTSGAEQLDLRLHFAERAHAEAGKRLFDIEVEGRKARTNFDIFNAAGGKNTATALTIDDVAVTDGSLTLALRASVDFPAISAIEVLCEGACPGPDRTAPAAPAGLAATGSEAGVSLDWENNRENDVAGYNVYRAASENGTFTKLNGQLVAASQYADAAAPAGATSFYKVEAVDASGNASGPATASAARPQASQAAVRINAGGPAQTVSGVAWRACDAITNCSGFVAGGGKYSENDTITGIPQGMNNAIFQSEWTGGRQSGVPAGGTAFSFNVPVQTGDYKLRLHFAELNKTANNTRVFDVNVEGGAKELTGFDIFKEAGGTNKAIVREIPVKVADGTVNIDFIAQVENAKISAIEILPTAPQDTEAPAAPQNLSATASEAGISLDWADNPEADLAGYNVSRSATASGAFTKLNGAPLAASAFKDVDVDAGKTYFYKVSAVDKAGNESGAAADSATMPDAAGFTTITWTNTNQNQPQSNSEGQGEVVGGKLYSFGGFDSKKPCCTPTSRAYSYTPATGWVRIANMPAQNGTPYGGVTHAGFTTDGEDIFWAGGYTSNGAGTGQIFGTREVWRYDVSGDRYAKMASLPADRAGGQLEYLGGKLYYFGGTNLARTQDVGNLYVLDLANQAAGWTERAAMPNGRHHLASAVIGGKVYAVGGQKAHDEALVPQADVHAYDPQSNTWTQKTSMPRAINHATSSTVVMGGRIVVVGGQTTHTTGVADVNAYDPATDAWTALTPLPAARHSAVAGVLDGNIYFSTGGTNATLRGVPGADTTAPKVAGVQPAENATDVGLGAGIIQASFNEAMDNASLTAAGNFVLAEVAENGDATPVAATVTTNGNKAILDPDADLEAGTKYTATIKGAVKDAAGNPLGADKTWSFSTQGYEPPDTTAPDAPTVRLAAGSDSGASNTDNTTNANKPTFEGAAEAGSTVEIFDGETSLGTAPANGSGDWSFTAPAALADGDHAVTARATDAAGNASPASAALRITIDTAAPDTALAASGPSGTSNSASAEFAFSSESDAFFECKLDAGSFAACASPKSYAGLANGQHTFSVRATDKAGNLDASAAERAWTVDVDTTPPTVQNVSPQADAINVAAGTNVTAIFSESMKASSIGGTTFTLKKGTTPVNATVTYDAQSRTATLDPAADLDEGANYTATVTAGVQDAAGNALGSARTWSFTTRQPADITPPAAPAITGPANNSYDTDGSVTVSGTAEANSTVELFENATKVGQATAGSGGNWSIPLQNVAEGSHTYAATATDAAGNASARSGGVTVTVDRTAPTVANVEPVAQSADVAVGTTVKAVFSEDMRASTIDNTTFKLVRASDGAPVAAGVTYGPASKTATLDPNADLNPNTAYTATVATGVQDVAGGAMASAKVWSFTTAQPADTTPPTVADVLPTAQAVDVAPATDVTATFSEAMLDNTIDANSFTLTRAADGAKVQASVGYDAASRKATLNPGVDLDAGKTYTAQISTAVKDAAGNALATTKVWSFTTKAAAPAQAPIRIEAGGQGRTVNGVRWLACTATTNCSGYVKGGFRYAPTTLPTVAKPVPPASNEIYQQEWTGGQTGANPVPVGQTAFSFDVPVQNGGYLVRLHFAEIAQNGAGRRLFDVNIEGGAKELANFDIFRAAGGMNRAIVREFDSQVTDGTMNIQFIRQVENAKISAIEILPVSGGAPAADKTAPATPSAVKATASPGGVALDWADSPEPDVAGYEVYRADAADGPFDKMSGTLSVNSQYNDATAQMGKTYHYRVVAVDQAGNKSAEAAASATMPSPPATRVNVGGGTVTGNGLSWSGCPSTTNCPISIVGAGKRTLYTGATASPAYPAALFEAGWSGGQSTGRSAGQRAFGFDANVPQGKYLVHLHFAEKQKTAASQRLFHINIENGRALSNLDVFAAAGGRNRAIVREFTVNSVGANGSLDIDFVTARGDAFVQAVEIIPQ